MKILLLISSVIAILVIAGVIATNKSLNYFYKNF